MFLHLIPKDCEVPTFSSENGHFGMCALKDKLLLEPVDVEEKSLPPLSALKNKILIKWKSGKKIQTDKLEDTGYDARAKFNEDFYNIKISVTKRVLMFSKIEEQS